MNKVAKIGNNYDGKPATKDLRSFYDICKIFEVK